MKYYYRKDELGDIPKFWVYLGDDTYLDAATLPIPIFTKNELVYLKYLIENSIEMEEYHENVENKYSMLKNILNTINNLIEE